MGLRDDLIAAKALIDTPEKWGKGKGSFASSYTGHPYSPVCAIGACNALAHKRRADGGRDNVLYAMLGKALQRAMRPSIMSVPDFNDAKSTTHADIMALFDRAIAAAEPSPQLIDAVRKEG